MGKLFFTPQNAIVAALRGRVAAETRLEIENTERELETLELGQMVTEIELSLLALKEASEREDTK